MAYIGNVPAEKYTALTQQTFSSPTGTSFTLSQAVTNPVDIDLYIDNVKQDPTTYSVSGTALTTSTIASPSTMYCIFNGRATETVNPPDDSVGLAQLAGGTDGNIISFDASGNPAYVATGNDGQVLTSAGAGQPCAFETLTTGKVVQVVNTQTGAVATGTTIMYADDTIPQITEGNEFMTLAITPTNASNKLIIEVIAHMTASYAGAQDIIGALFNTDNHSTNALATSFVAISNQYGIHSHPLRHYVTAGTTSATTFRFRGGSASSGTLTLNGLGGSRYFAGVLISSMTITEIAV